MIRRSLIIFFSLFLSFKAQCNAFGDFPVSYLGIEQGLSNNGVTSIYQDRDGFMWFGTFDGLNRYDGYSFKIFRNDLKDSTSLNGNYIRVISADIHSHLWVGTTKGLNIFNTSKGNFFSTFYRVLNNKTVRTLEGDVRAIQLAENNGLMLVGLYNTGLVVFKDGSREGIQIPFLPGKGKELDYNVAAIAIDTQHQFAWVFVQQAGLCKYDFTNQTIELINSTIKYADCLKYDSKGNLWLGNQSGLFQYDQSSNKFSTNFLPSIMRVMNIFEDKLNNLWISSDGEGVWWMPNRSSIPIAYDTTRNHSMISSNSIYAIYDDLQGNKWIGTLRGGISVILSKTKLFNHITINEQDAKNSVNNFILSFAEDSGNNVWIGTEGAGLKYWNRNKNLFTSFRHDPNNKSSISSDFVTSMIIDSYGDLWATTWFGGVNKIEKGGRAFLHFDCFNSNNNLVENNAWQVLEDSHRRLWVSTMNGGSLYQFNRNANRFEVFDPTLTNIQGPYEDKQGQIWAGSHTSLIQIDTEMKKHKFFAIGQGVRCMYEDSDGNFWIGTDGGGLLLFNRSNGLFQRFTISEGLPSNTILRILEDKKKNLWLSTYNGICRFSSINHTCRNYSQLDGLQSNQFTFNAALMLKSGEFLFGGIKGFNIFFPDSIHERTEVSRLFLSSLRINNRPIEDLENYVKIRSLDKIEKIEVPFADAVLSLGYLALDYNDADKIKYSYILQGWDKNWIDANDIRIANYSGLREGTYEFKIRVKDGANEWSSPSKLITVVVLPPWYRTWWAYLLYFILFIGAVYFALMYYKRQQRLKYEVKLANYEAKIANLEKVREREMAEKKISFFTNISHEFRTPLTLIINPVKDLLQRIEPSDEKKELTVIHRNARRLLSLIDQLLIFRKADVEADNLKISKVNFYQLCKEVYLCFVQQAKMNTQEYVFECENEHLEMFVDKEKLEIAVFNLISNAIKYTDKGGKIVFKICENENDIIISVIDNGQGISKLAAPRLFEKFYQAPSGRNASQTGFGIGLYLVKHFIEGHQGSVTFQSEEGKGTTFLVFLKKGISHLSQGFFEQDEYNKPLILDELKESSEEEGVIAQTMPEKLEELVKDQRTLLIVDDDKSIRQYLGQVFKEKYQILEAQDGATALKIAEEQFPDLIITDIQMNNMSGIELCKQIKSNVSLNYIPIILLTAGQSSEIELHGIEVGADVYIRKPFDKDLLIAKVENLFKSRNELQNYFFNEITLKKNTLKISPEYKEFLEACIRIVENHLLDNQFSVKVLSYEIGMSHNQLYKKVKTISGQTVTSFIRYIRLRKAAELLISGDCNVNQAAYMVGFADVKYFRSQFLKLFGINPSTYIKKYRNSFNKKYTLSSNVVKDDPKK